MNTRAIGVGVVGVLIVVAVLISMFLGSDGSVLSAPLRVTDLVVGQIYQIADFSICSFPNGSLATEWHFGGADRSRRNQLTPRLDGRGRRILQVVTGDKTLPVGYMRLRKVAEVDPTLEGFTYGSYSWAGLLVEYNGRVESQSVVGPCGPAR